VAAHAVAETVMLKSRLSSIPVLSPSPEPVIANHRFVSVPRVEIDEGTQRAASALARAEGLEVVDLVPGDLSTEQALEFLRTADPRQLRKTRLREGRGAYQALLVDAEVLHRAGASDVTQLDPPSLAALTVRLKRFASSTFGSAIAPELRAADEDPAVRPVRMAAVYDGIDGLTLRLTRTAIGQGLAARGLAPRSPLRWIALGLMSAEPYLVFLGSRLRPHDLGPSGLLRPLQAPLRLARLVGSALGQTIEPPPSQEDRSFYAERLEGGVDRLLERRRDTCPWCGSGHLTVQLSTRDLMQHKPGRFTMERCHECGLVFQNPRLSEDGLNYYYRDYYDGAGARMTGWIFDSQAQFYEARARVVAKHTAPRRWLDVGAGHGHFCNQAREILPDTSFEALDISAGCEEAARRRWVDRAHRGLFPELAGDLVGRFDVVSMHHYLEHTRDPRQELDAAARVLPEGGYLLIEMPNPESGLGRVLGRWWLPWFQPQHLQMLPMAQLVEALRERGFEILETELGPAHQPVDLTGAAALCMWRLAPNPRLPWRPDPPGRADSVRHGLVLVASLVPILLGAVLDQLAAPVIRAGSLSNAYRILARKSA
jgi:ubiquinone/menaquinone biosynthesis C-methylase UbiE